MDHGHDRPRRRRSSSGSRARAGDAATGPDSPLLDLLRDADVTVIEAAAWALGELGDAAIAGQAVAALATVGQTHADPLARGGRGRRPRRAR